MPKGNDDKANKSRQPFVDGDKPFQAPFKSVMHFGKHFAKEDAGLFGFADTRKQWFVEGDGAAFKNYEKQIGSLHDARALGYKQHQAKKLSDERQEKLLKHSEKLSQIERFKNSTRTEMSAHESRQYAKLAQELIGLQADCNSLTRDINIFLKKTPEELEAKAQEIVLPRNGLYQSVETSRDYLASESFDDVLEAGKKAALISKFEDEYRHKLDTTSIMIIGEGKRQQDEYYNHYTIIGFTPDKRKTKQIEMSYEKLDETFGLAYLGMTPRTDEVVAIAQAKIGYQVHSDPYINDFRRKFVNQHPCEAMYRDDTCESLAKKVTKLTEEQKRDLEQNGQAENVPVFAGIDEHHKEQQVFLQTQEVGAIHWFSAAALSIPSFLLFGLGKIVISPVLWRFNREESVPSPFTSLFKELFTAQRFNDAYRSYVEGMKLSVRRQKQGLAGNLFERINRYLVADKTDEYGLSTEEYKVYREFIKENGDFRITHIKTRANKNATDSTYATHSNVQQALLDHIRSERGALEANAPGIFSRVLAEITTFGDYAEQCKQHNDYKNYLDRLEQEIVLSNPVLAILQDDNHRDKFLDAFDDKFPKDGLTKIVTGLATLLNFVVDETMKTKDAIKAMFSSKPLTNNDKYERQKANQQLANEIIAVLADPENVKESLELLDECRVANESDTPFRLWQGFKNWMNDWHNPSNKIEECQVYDNYLLACYQMVLSGEAPGEQVAKIIDDSDTSSKSLERFMTSVNNATGLTDAQGHIIQIEPMIDVPPFRGQFQYANKGYHRNKESAVDKLLDSHCGYLFAESFSYFLTSAQSKEVGITKAELIQHSSTKTTVASDQRSGILKCFYSDNKSFLKKHPRTVELSSWFLKGLKIINEYYKVEGSIYKSGTRQLRDALLEQLDSLDAEGKYDKTSDKSPRHRFSELAKQRNQLISSIQGEEGLIQKGLPPQLLDMCIMSITPRSDRTLIDMLDERLASIDGPYGRLMDLILSHGLNRIDDERVDDLHKVTLRYLNTVLQNVNGQSKEGMKRAKGLEILKSLVTADVEDLVLDKNSMECLNSLADNNRLGISGIDNFARYCVGRYARSYLQWALSGKCKEEQSQVIKKCKAFVRLADAHSSYNMTAKYHSVADMSYWFIADQFNVANGDETVLADQQGSIRMSNYDDNYVVVKEEFKDDKLVKKEAEKLKKKADKATQIGLGQSLKAVVKSVEEGNRTQHILASKKDAEAAHLRIKFNRQMSNGVKASVTGYLDGALQGGLERLEMAGVISEDRSKQLADRYENEQKALQQAIEQAINTAIDKLPEDMVSPDTALGALKFCQSDLVDNKEEVFQTLDLVTGFKEFAEPKHNKQLYSNYLQRRQSALTTVYELLANSESRITVHYYRKQCEHQALNVYIQNLSSCLQQLKKKGLIDDVAVNTIAGQLRQLKTVDGATDLFGDMFQATCRYQHSVAKTLVEVIIERSPTSPQKSIAALFPLAVAQDNNGLNLFNKRISQHKHNYYHTLATSWIRSKAQACEARYVKDEMNNQLEKLITTKSLEKDGFVSLLEILVKKDALNDAQKGSIVQEYQTTFCEYLFTQRRPLIKHFKQGVTGKQLQDSLGNGVNPTPDQLLSSVKLTDQFDEGTFAEVLYREKMYWLKAQIPGVIHRAKQAEDRQQQQVGSNDKPATNWDEKKEQLLSTVERYKHDKVLMITGEERKELVIQPCKASKRGYSNEGYDGSNSNAAWLLRLNATHPQAAKWVTCRMKHLLTKNAVEFDQNDQAFLEHKKTDIHSENSFEAQAFNEALAAYISDADKTQAGDDVYGKPTYQWTFKTQAEVERFANRTNKEDYRIKSIRKLLKKGTRVGYRGEDGERIYTLHPDAAKQIQYILDNPLGDRGKLFTPEGYKKLASVLAAHLKYDYETFKADKNGAKQKWCGTAHHIFWELASIELPTLWQELFINQLEYMQQCSRDEEVSVKKLSLDDNSDIQTGVLRGNKEQMIQKYVAGLNHLQLERKLAMHVAQGDITDEQSNDKIASQLDSIMRAFDTDYDHKNSKLNQLGALDVFEQTNLLPSNILCSVKRFEGEVTKDKQEEGMAVNEIRFIQLPNNTWKIAYKYKVRDIELVRQKDITARGGSNSRNLLQVLNGLQGNVLSTAARNELSGSGARFLGLTAALTYQVIMATNPDKDDSYLSTATDAFKAVLAQLNQQAYEVAEKYYGAGEKLDKLVGNSLEQFKQQQEERARVFIESRIKECTQLVGKTEKLNGQQFEELLTEEINAVNRGYKKILNKHYTRTTLPNVQHALKHCADKKTNELNAKLNQLERQLKVLNRSQDEGKLQEKQELSEQIDKIKVEKDNVPKVMAQVLASCREVNPRHPFVNNAGVQKAEKIFRSGLSAAVKNAFDVDNTAILSAEPQDSYLQAANTLQEKLASYIREGGLAKSQNDKIIECFVEDKRQASSGLPGTEKYQKLVANVKQVFFDDEYSKGKTIVTAYMATKRQDANAAMNDAIKQYGLLLNDIHEWFDEYAKTHYFAEHNKSLNDNMTALKKLYIDNAPSFLSNAHTGLFIANGSEGNCKRQFKQHLDELIANYQNVLEPHCVLPRTAQLMSQYSQDENSALNLQVKEGDDKDTRSQSEQWNEVFNACNQVSNEQISSNPRFEELKAVYEKLNEGSFWELRGEKDLETLFAEFVPTDAIYLLEWLRFFEIMRRIEDNSTSASKELIAAVSYSERPFADYQHQLPGNDITVEGGRRYFNQELLAEIVHTAEGKRFLKEVLFKNVVKSKAPYNRNVAYLIAHFGYDETLDKYHLKLIDACLSQNNPFVAERMILALEKEFAIGKNARNSLFRPLFKTAEGREAFAKKIRKLLAKKPNDARTIANLSAIIENFGNDDIQCEFRRFRIMQILAGENDFYILNEPENVVAASEKRFNRDETGYFGGLSKPFGPTAFVNMFGTAAQTADLKQFLKELMTDHTRMDAASDSVKALITNLVLESGLFDAESQLMNDWDDYQSDHYYDEAVEKKVSQFAHFVQELNPDSAIQCHTTSAEKSTKDSGTANMAGRMSEKRVRRGIERHFLEVIKGLYAYMGRADELKRLHQQAERLLCTPDTEIDKIKPLVKEISAFNIGDYASPTLKFALYRIAGNILLGSVDTTAYINQRFAIYAAKLGDSTVFDDNQELRELLRIMPGTRYGERGFLELMSTYLDAKKISKDMSDEEKAKKIALFKKSSTKIVEKFKEDTTRLIKNKYSNITARFTHFVAQLTEAQIKGVQKKAIDFNASDNSVVALLQATTPLGENKEAFLKEVDALLNMISDKLTAYDRHNIKQLRQQLQHISDVGYSQLTQRIGKLSKQTDTILFRQELTSMIEELYRDQQNRELKTVDQKAEAIDNAKTIQAIQGQVKQHAEQHEVERVKLAAYELSVHNEVKQIEETIDKLKPMVNDFDQSRSAQRRGINTKQIADETLPWLKKNEVIINGTYHRFAAKLERLNQQALSGQAPRFELVDLQVGVLSDMLAMLRRGLDKTRKESLISTINQICASKECNQTTLYIFKFIKELLTYKNDLTQLNLDFLLQLHGLEENKVHSVVKLEQCARGIACWEPTSPALVAKAAGYKTQVKEENYKLLAQLAKNNPATTKVVERLKNVLGMPNARSNKGVSQSLQAYEAYALILKKVELFPVSQDFIREIAIGFQTQFGRNLTMKFQLNSLKASISHLENAKPNSERAQSEEVGALLDTVVEQFIYLCSAGIKNQRTKQQFDALYGSAKAHRDYFKQNRISQSVLDSLIDIKSKLEQGSQVTQNDWIKCVTKLTDEVADPARIAKQYQRIEASETKAVLAADKTTRDTMSLRIANAMHKKAKEYGTSLRSFADAYLESPIGESVKEFYDAAIVVTQQVNHKIATFNSDSKAVALIDDEDMKTLWPAVGNKMDSEYIDGVKEKMSICIEQILSIGENKQSINELLAIVENKILFNNFANQSQKNRWKALQLTQEVTTILNTMHSGSVNYYKLGENIAFVRATLPNNCRMRQAFESELARYPSKNISFDRQHEEHTVIIEQLTIAKIQTLSSAEIQQLVEKFKEVQIHGSQVQVQTADKQLNNVVREFVEETSKDGAKVNVKACKAVIESLVATGPLVDKLNDACVAYRNKRKIDPTSADDVTKDLLKAMSDGPLSDIAKFGDQLKAIKKASSLENRVDLLQAINEFLDKVRVLTSGTKVEREQLPQWLKGADAKGLKEAITFVCGDLYQHVVNEKAQHGRTAKAGLVLTLVECFQKHKQSAISNDKQLISAYLKDLLQVVGGVSANSGLLINLSSHDLKTYLLSKEASQIRLIYKQFFGSELLQGTRGQTPAEFLKTIRATIVNDLNSAAQAKFGIAATFNVEASTHQQLTSFTTKRSLINKDILEANFETCIQLLDPYCVPEAKVLSQITKDIMQLKQVTKTQLMQLLAPYDARVATAVTTAVMKLQQANTTMDPEKLVDAIMKSKQVVDAIVQSQVARFASAYVVVTGICSSHNDGASRNKLHHLEQAVKQLNTIHNQASASNAKTEPHDFCGTPYAGKILGICADGMKKESDIPGKKEGIVSRANVLRAIKMFEQGLKTIECPMISVSNWGGWTTPKVEKSIGWLKPHYFVDLAKELFQEHDVFTLDKLADFQKNSAEQWTQLYRTQLCRGTNNADKAFEHLGDFPLKAVHADTGTYQNSLLALLLICTRTEKLYEQLRNEPEVSVQAKLDAYFSDVNVLLLECKLLADQHKLFINDLNKLFKQTLGVERETKNILLFSKDDSETVYIGRKRDQQPKLKQAVSENNNDNAEDSTVTPSSLFNATC